MKHHLLLLTTASVLGGAGFSQAAPILRITEAMSNGDVADWFEVTNYGDTAANITNHRMDDNSFAAGTSVALSGVTSIAPGESVIFIEGSSITATTFKTNWSLATTQVGYYSGTGVSLSSTADGVTIFNGPSPTGTELTGPFGGLIRVSFGLATAGTSFEWRYDATGASLPSYVAQLSTAGLTWTNGSTVMVGTPGFVPSPTVDLSKYVRVGRYDLPEPTRTTPPTNSLLAQEASGVTYNWDTGTLFIVGDGGTSVTEVTKTGALVSSMTLPPGGSAQGTEFYDTEGITYIGGGQFVMTEERDRQAVKFTYVPGGTLTRGAAQTVKLGTTIGNIGLEGLSYDQQTGGFIFVKEMDPEGIFQTTIDFAAGTASNGSPITVNSTNLFNPALASLEDMSDVFAFSNIPSMVGQTQAGNLLILSQESGMIRNVDRSGNILSTLTLVADSGNPLTIQNQTHEGITMDRAGNIYVVSENGGGDMDHPQLWVYSPSSAANLAPSALALSSASSSIPESSSTAVPVKLATIVVTDADGVGVNNLTVSGADASSFEIIGSGLYLKSGTVLNYATKPTYSVTVDVDDSSVGSTPDVSASFVLNITGVAVGSGPIRITEVAPWSSGNSAVGADWFELTNTSGSAVDISGWKMTDSAATFGAAGPITGITSIGAGESVIFVDQSKITQFITNWFGANPPAGLQFGTYGGPGLSTGGDSVTIYDAGGTLQARVDFGASPASAPFGTFDNTAGLNNATISQLSVVGQNGAFTAFATANEIGSPGTATLGTTPIVSITATDATAAEAGTDPGTFRISRTGSTTSAMTVLFSIATGSGQATSGDYSPTLTSPATIPAGAAFVDITITPVDDNTVEGAETVTLTLGDTGSYDVGSPASATITITDNDVNLPPSAVALANTVTVLSESASTAADVRVADITVTDDGNGTNTLSVSGADAGFFTITGSSLYLKAGTALSYATKPSYNVTVNVDDTTVGATPDANTNFTLSIAQAVAPGSIVITEVNSSGSSASYAADWFELTNVGSTDINIAGWQMDDNSNGTAKVAMRGVTVIPAGKTAVFFEGLADGSTDSTILANFSTAWFGSATPPSGVLIGAYGGAGVGLSSSGDAVNVFDAAGNRVTGVAFGSLAIGATLDNKTAALGSTITPLPTISTLSVIGTNGGFRSAANTETGSPGYTVTSTISFTAATATVSEAAGSVTLNINRTGDTSAANVTVNTANGTGTAGTDYTAVTAQTVNFAANATTATVSVPVINRAGIRTNRTFTATLSAPKFAAVLGATTTATVTITEADSYASMTGPSSSRTPYIQSLASNWQVTSLLTVGDQVPVSANAGSTPLVGGNYELAGIPDGVGAFDNGDGTFTMLVHHEHNNTQGVTRAHGSVGGFVSEWIINKSTLQVVSGSDLIREVYGWDSVNQVSNSTPGTFTFNRLCSADLPAHGAYYNPTTGLGTQERLFMGGDESGSNGFALATVATGVNKGRTYILGKFNLTTNGSGLTGVGGWENLLANPFTQDKTIVIGNNDGGTGIMGNAVAVYQGTKTNTGTEADKAGLTNGTLKFVNVAGNTAETVNTTTRVTNITSGTRFSLSATASTTFSRPEDGAWDPSNPRRFYFVTTDQLDRVADGISSQIGRTRLWRLTFDDITNPDAGGVIDLLIEGGGTLPVANDANMFDNLTVTADGKVVLCEDVGGAPHNGKVWFYDPVTTSLTKIIRHDISRFGDVVAGTVTNPTAPFTNDEETSGVIDVTHIFGGNAATGERTFLIVDQAHYSTGITTAQVEGGQLLLLKQAATFLGIASGDADSSSATLWAGYSKTAASMPINVQVATDAVFTAPTTIASSTPSAANGWTTKASVTGLSAGTTWFYRFVETTTGEVSATGKFKTAPASTTAAGLRFAFSGDNDGIMRPYPLASTIPAQNLDFYVNLGDTIYENASASLGNNGASWLNSPSVAVSGASNTTTPSSTGATQAQLAADYAKKYKENFLPVNVGGQNALKDFYAAQGNYTQFDNHELGNRQYINGGAPRGGAVGDMSTGAGVNASDTSFDVNSSVSGDFMNKAPGFQTLIQTYLNWMPVKEDRAGGSGLISTPGDSRTDGTHQFYFGQQWGRNAIYINADDRSYRDIRLKTAGNADDTGTRAANPNRTMLGDTQFGWLKQQLLAAQAAGVPWKFVAVSDPIDQLGPIGGALTGTLTSVNADGGKSWIGGYRAERNALLKYIADNHITNVVFLATDDHQNRINELTYSPTDTENQSTYVKVPYCFSIVCGPLGATGPETIANHSFSNIKAIADSLAAAQSTAGIEPLGLMGYPGLKNLVREGDATAGTSPQAVDFYSPDTFNYTVFDVSADGKTLSVTSKGINSFAQNAALEYDAVNNPARTVFSFQVDAASSLESWRLSEFGTTSTSGDLAVNADYDGDGVANLVEYGLGIKPNDGNGVNGPASLPLALSGDPDSSLSDRLALSFSLPNPTPPDVTYLVQATDDLINYTDVARKVGTGSWNWVAGGTSHIVTSGSGPVSVKIGDVVESAGNPRRMMRLVVTNP